MKSDAKSHQDFNTGLLYRIEQWIALLVGIACLAAFLCSIWNSREAFSMQSLSDLGQATLVTTGWLLTIAVGILGVTLTRFALHEYSEPEPDAKAPSESVRSKSVN